MYIKPIAQKIYIGSGFVGDHPIIDDVKKKSKLYLVVSILVYSRKTSTKTWNKYK